MGPLTFQNNNGGALKNLILCVFMVLAMVLAVAGCSGIDIPTPKEVLKNPIGPDSVKVGMTVQEVLSRYGEPNSKRMVTGKSWATEREEWYYHARMSGLPVGADYLSNDLYLYFDGDNLTNISKTPLGAGKE